MYCGRGTLSSSQILFLASGDAMNKDHVDISECLTLETNSNSYNTRTLSSPNDDDDIDLDVEEEVDVNQFGDEDVNVVVDASDDCNGYELLNYVPFKLSRHGHSDG